jgi:anti-sigma factor RsiW
MSEPETLPRDVHPEIALLPWYANGTLGAEERQQVARHLESCADCRRELDELRQMKSELSAVYKVHREPSPRLIRSVLAKVAREASARRGAPAETGSWLDRLDQWFRSLFLPQWVPTLAAVILLTQLGLLLWVTMPPMPSDQITTRSLGSPTATFKVTFQEQATEGQIRALLSTVHGRVIDGPNPEHVYVIEVIAGDPAVNVKTLETLRARTDVVHSAETIAP